MSISEIARECGFSPSQVAGAIRGAKGQYDPALSLLQLHLVAESITKIPGERRQKRYKFDVKNQALVANIEKVLARYRKAGEG